MKKALVLGLLVMLLFSGLAMLSPGAHATASTQTRATDDSIHIYAMTHPSSEYPSWGYFTIAYKNINMSLRIVVKNSTGGNTILSTSPTWTVVSNDNHELHLSANSNAINLYITVNNAVDAEGDEYLKFHAYATTTNETQYNTTTFLLYTGANSSYDTDFISKVMDGTYYDYYGLKGAGITWHAVPEKSGAWLVAVSSSGVLYGKTAYLAGSSIQIEAALGGFTIADKRKWDNNELNIAIKVKQPATTKITGPKVLSFAPYSNSSLILRWDNESIYKIAAETYHYEYVLLFDEWMQPATYDALNTQVKNAILNISNYCHKYGLKFGLYFGWRAYVVASGNVGYSQDNVSRMLTAWNNFTAKWGDFVDFYYFDFGTAINDAWSYWNWYYLNQVWSNISDNKYIIYNGQNNFWWLGGRFIPLLWETKHIDVVQTYYSKLPLDEPLVHSLNYSSIIFDKAMYDSYTTYNATLAEEFTDYFYKWGLTPSAIYEFQYPYNIGFPDFIKHFKDWRGDMYIYHDIGGTVGTRNVQLENTNEIRLLLTDTQSQITVTPHVAKLPVEIYTNKTVKIEYEINPSPNIIVKDLTTGANVPWTKGSVIFPATAGHTYEIYDVVQESVNAAYSIVPVMFTLVIVIMVISVIGGMMKVATKGFKGGRGARH